VVIVFFVLYTCFAVFWIHKAFKLYYDTRWRIRGIKKMDKSKLGVISVIALIVFILSVGLVAGQYTTQKTTDLVLGSDGTCSVSEADLGITYVVQGTPGASGSVTAAIYNGNPQPLASIPSGVALSHFVVVTFSMDASDFSQATITLNYAEGDVQNIQTPYSVYKYVPESDSFVALPSIVDTVAKTITISLDSVDDPLFAIGGSTEVATTSPVPVWTWVATISVIIIIVLIAVLLLKRRNPLYYVER
jgi:hypothetical protein